MGNLREEYMSKDNRTIFIQYIYDTKLCHKLELTDKDNNIWRFIPAEKWMTLRFMYENVNGQKIYEGVDTDGLGMMILVGSEVCSKKVEEITYEKWTDGNYYAFIRFADEESIMKPDGIHEKKYLWQVCQDSDINCAFIKLHHEIVDKIIKFCKDYSLKVDEVNFDMDHVMGSTQYGSWQPCTDSCLTMYEKTLSTSEVENGGIKPYLRSL